MKALRPEIWVYWGPRHEDARACAIRFAHMLENLRSIHPVFARFYFTGFPPTARNMSTRTPIPGLDTMTKAFEKGVSYKDVPREPIPERGYTIGGSNGRPSGEHLAFLITAGRFFDYRIFPNTVNFHGGFFDTAEGDWVNAAVLSAALRTLVTAWDADWARVYDWDYKNPRADPPQLRDMPPFHSGWIVYLSSRFADRIVPPPQASVEDVPGHGLMIYATRETFDVDNWAHIAAADAIQDALEPIQGLVKKRMNPLRPRDLGGL